MQTNVQIPSEFAAPTQPEPTHGVEAEEDVFYNATLLAEQSTKFQELYDASMQTNVQIPSEIAAPTQPEQTHEVIKLILDDKANAFYRTVYGDGHLEFLISRLVESFVAANKKNWSFT